MRTDGAAGAQTPAAGAAGQAPAATGTQTQTGQQGTQQAAGGEYKPPTADEYARIQKEIGDLRKESAERRVKAKEAEDAASKAAEATKSAELQKAQAEGRWNDVVKLEREKAEAALKRAADAEARVTSLSPYESVVKAEVDQLRAALGDKAAAVPADLTLAQQLPILRTLRDMAAGPGQSHASTAGAPAPVASLPDIERMTPEQRRAYYGSITHEQRRALAGAHDQAPPWLRPPTK